MRRPRLENLRLRSAVVIIVASTAVIVLASALLAVLLDKRDFADTGEALWWSLQTVTTVGYGDVVPVTAYGRVIAGIVMLLGIAASAVLTAIVTSALFEAALRRHGRADVRDLLERLDAIDERLSSIASSLPGDPL
jgi:voltage-gated potassium channel